MKTAKKAELEAALDELREAAAEILEVHRREWQGLPEILTRERLEKAIEAAAKVRRTT